MATQKEILERLDTAATNAENATDAYYEVLTTEGEQDINLVDGTTTPNLNKRLKNYIGAVKSVQGMTGDVKLKPSDITQIGSRGLNPTAVWDVVQELVDTDGVRDPVANAQAQALLNRIEYINGKKIGYIDYISSLSTVENVADGTLIIAKKYSNSINGGGGKLSFKRQDTTTTNNVTVFDGVGGKWHRVNWKNPDIYDAGIDGSEADATNKFQALVDAAADLGFDVDLRYKEVKITKLDIPSNTTIKRGTINTLSSTWANTYGRAPLMLKNTDRNAAGVDYEIKADYEKIVTIENIHFEDITFKSDTFCGLFFKFNNLSFIRCKGYWQQQNLFKFVGGINGTPLTADTPTSYTINDPINGWCKYINIHDCYWYGGYRNKDYSSPFRFNGCANVNISGGINDSPLGWHIDSYNKDFTLTSADYINTNLQVVADTVTGAAQADMFALYVGQCSYNITVTGGKWRNFGKKGAYTECCSNVVIDGVEAQMTVDNVATFVDMQPNWKDNANSVWGNVSDITVKNCTSKGTRYGVQCTPYQNVKSLRKINILDNTINTNSTFEAIVLTGVEDYLIKNNHCNGSLFLGPNNTKGLVKGSEFYNASNFAMYIADQAGGELPEFFDNSFVVGVGSAIYNNGGSSKSGFIVGGKIKAGSGSTLMQLGVAANLVAYDFENGVTQRSQNFSQTINVAGNSTSATINKPISGVKEGWTASINVHGIVALGYDLTFIVSCENDGIAFKVKNNSSTAVNFNPNLLLKLNSFCDQVFKN